MNYKIAIFSLALLSLNTVDCGTGYKMWSAALDKKDQNLAEYIYFAYELDKKKDADFKFDDEKELYFDAFNLDLANAKKPSFGGGDAFGWKDGSSKDAMSKFTNLFKDGSPDDVGVKASKALYDAADADKTKKGDYEKALRAGAKVISDYADKVSSIK